MPSELQSAKWEVSSIKAPFGSLRLPISLEIENRKRFLTIYAHLFNWKNRPVGINQIGTVYVA